MKPKLALCTSTIVFAACVAQAYAAASGQSVPSVDKQHPSAQFLQLDSNRDGYLSSSETASLRGFHQASAQADDDKDGKLDADEFIKAQAIQDRLQLAQYTDDSVITAKVKAVLIKDMELNAFEVGVETYRGRVLLSGFVDDQRQAQRAAQLAAGVHGVTQVENALQLK
ncbi:MAG: BON domain-containing protein [Burkholderiales bacterium]|nr:BON domain-containing protein [Burkholderiales bacterium]